MKKRIWIIASAAVLLLAGAYIWNSRPSHTPAGQPPLVELNAIAFDTLKAEFNRASERFRMIVLLSPT